MTLSDRLEGFARQHGWLFGTATLIGLPVPWLAGLANPSYLAVAGLAVAAAALLAAVTLPGEQRRAFLGLFWIGGAIRFYAHLGLFAWASAAGGPFLGPDSSTYFGRSLLLAAQGLRIDDNPIRYFRSYDAAQYYLFALNVRYLNADFYALQLLNGALTAVAAPLLYAACRQFVPAAAGLIGFTLAIYPSLVALSINELLKDPSVVAALAVAAWALVSLAARPGRARIAWALAAAAAVTYLRMSRTYTPAFLEIALLAALCATLLAARVTNVKVLVWFVAVFVVAEAVPWRLGWPPSPVMLIAQARHSLATPEMLRYGPGLLDRDDEGFAGRTGPAGEGVTSRAGPVRGRSVHEIVRSVRMGLFFPGAGVRLAVSHPPPPTPKVPDPPWTVRLGEMAVNGVRKVLGPFPWVPPPAWDARTILLGDYLLFPGVLLWYAIIPFGLAGLAAVIGRLRDRAPVPLALVALTVFASLLVAMYLALNISYRQREVTFPLILVLAVVGWDAVAGSATWWRVYRFYWVLILLVAVAHLGLRAWLR